MIGRRGSPGPCSRYLRGWAVTFFAPQRMFKRYSSYVGGISLGLVSEWKKLALFAMGAS